MLAYYEIALKTFIDNVPNLAIHASIVHDIPHLFRFTDVLHMDRALVQTIASEPQTMTARREHLIRSLKTLNDGMRILRQHAIRPRTQVAEAGNSARQPNSNSRAPEINIANDNASPAPKTSSSTPSRSKRDKVTFPQSTAYAGEASMSSKAAGKQPQTDSSHLGNASSFMANGNFGGGNHGSALFGGSPIPFVGSGSPRAHSNTSTNKASFSFS